MTETKRGMSQEIVALRKQKKAEREKITLFKSPIRTAVLFVSELLIWLKNGIRWASRHHLISAIGFIFLGVVALLKFVEGHHTPMFIELEEKATFALHWVLLGVLSSVGLGTGLHTFVLYLGPHIAKVTLAATECNSLDFATYGANALLCPENVPTESVHIHLLSIFRKVRWEAILWGAGTALGELPPYFVARAARMSGEAVEEDEESEKDSGIVTRAKKYFDSFLGRSSRIRAFFMILLLASVPNPLFDLAGLTCGFSLIPFWTFFGATFIGKALVKANMQSIFVITAFSKEHLEKLVRLVETLIPSLQGKAMEFFEKERAKFHPDYEAPTASSSKSPLAAVWDVLLAGMLLMFAVSIINSTAQRRQLEEDETEIAKLTNKGGKKGNASSGAARKNKPVNSKKKAQKSKKQSKK